MSFHLNTSEKRMLLKTARESIRSRLDADVPVYDHPSAQLMESCGAFVTLRIDEDLRGCIGHIMAYRPLFKAVQELARSSAFNDPRFPPLSPNELEKIDIEISVLTPLEKIQDPEKVIVGKHGCYVELEGQSGVLLPQVPVEQGWNREEFLHHLCLKAGLSPGCLSHPHARLYVFEAIIFGEKEILEI